MWACYEAMLASLFTWPAGDITSDFCNWFPLGRRTPNASWMEYPEHIEIHVSRMTAISKQSGTTSSQKHNSHSLTMRMIQTIVMVLWPVKTLVKSCERYDQEWPWMTKHKFINNWLVRWSDQRWYVHLKRQLFSIANRTVRVLVDETGTTTPNHAESWALLTTKGPMLPKYDTNLFIQRLVEQLTTAKVYDPSLNGYGTLIVVEV